MEYDKLNGDVGFLEKPHLYVNVKDPKIKYVSVTTLISKFEQPYDKEFWSAYKALERLLSKEDWSIEKKSLLKSKKFNKEILDAYNISENEFNKAQQDILDEWQKSNIESCERGTKIHADLENSFYEGKGNLSKFGIGGKFECKKNYYTFDLENGLYPEYLIYYDHDDLHLAGQVDLIIKEGNDIIIIDHKSNKEIKQKSYYDPSSRKYSMMKYPLTNLQDCNFNHYQLQLSTYAWMLQKLNPLFNIKGLYINHFDHNEKNTIYRCEYLKDDVMHMLAWHKKQIKNKIRNDKYKRFDY